MYKNFDSDSDSDELNELTGLLLNSKYLLITIIGKGTFSIVWLKLNIKNYKYYAIKMQNTEDYDSGMFEVNVLKKVSGEKCPYINNMIEHFIYDSDEIDGRHVCMVFDI